LRQAQGCAALFEPGEGAVHPGLQGLALLLQPELKVLRHLPKELPKEKRRRRIKKRNNYSLIEYQAQ